jgi:hypothetical protein
MSRPSLIGYRVFVEQHLGRADDVPRRRCAGGLVATRGRPPAPWEGALELDLQREAANDHDEAEGERAVERGVDGQSA